VTLVPRCGYLSQGDPRLVLGLGDATRVDRVHITWPDGETQELRNLEVDRVTTVTQGASVQ